MEKDLASPIIFYLVQEENLPENFYRFDLIFKEYGAMVVPVHIDQLQMLASSTEQSQIIVLSSVANFRELKAFSKVRKLLKLVLKSKRITFFQLSSFSSIDDSKHFTIQKNYFFMKYPINAKSLAARIIRYHELKSEKNSKWPGGRRAGIGSLSV